MTFEGRFRAVWGRGLAALLALDCAFPRGAINRLFYGRRWFPTNLTGFFAGALTDPGGAGATLLVSAATPFFWALLAATAAFSVPAVRRKAWALPFALSALFLLSEFFLPWWGESAALERVMDALFPIVPRGHGRAYEAVYLYALPLLALWCFLRRGRPQAHDGQPPPIRVK